MNDVEYFINNITKIKSRQSAGFTYLLPRHSHLFVPHSPLFVSLIHLKRHNHFKHRNIYFELLFVVEIFH